METITVKSNVSLQTLEKNVAATVTKTHVILGSKILPIPKNFNNVIWTDSRTFNALPEITKEKREKIHILANPLRAAGWFEEPVTRLGYDAGKGYETAHHPRFGYLKMDKNRQHWIQDI